MLYSNMRANQADEPTVTLLVRRGDRLHVSVLVRGGPDMNAYVEKIIACPDIDVFSHLTKLHFRLSLCS